MGRALSWRFGAAFGAAILVLGASPAIAQDDDERIVSFGIGPQIVPSYPGSDEYELAPLFGGHVRRPGQPIPARGPDDGFGFSLTGRGGPVEIGPMIQFQGERENKDVGAPVGEIDFAFEPGVFANFNISDNFRVRVEGRRGFGGHEGWVGDVGADFFVRGGTETVFSIGPRVRLADSEWMRTYFGVTPAAAAAAGIPAYTPDGGVKALGLVSGITHQISPSFGVYAYAGYERLVGDAADSPIVTRFGSQDQFSGGVALYYSFRMRSPF
jgi:outer membrane scaffolding protein for murein synthesis (MipA/OmpV family)